MAASVTSSSSESGDSDSEADTSSCEEQELELSSWGKIYESLILLPLTSRPEDSKYNLIFYFANGAVQHGDFVNAVKLYSLGLASFCKKCEQKDSSSSEGIDGTSSSRGIPFDKRLLRYALEECSQNKNRLACKQFRYKLVKILNVILECCDQLSLMDCSLLQTVAALYFSLKEKQKSFQLSARAVQMNPNLLSIQEMFENICCHLVERWHFVMLNDKERNYAYQQAIETVLRQLEQKAIICDVGCGTGILSLIACQHPNSAQVFAIEKSASMCDVASSVFSMNLDPTVAGKIILINKLSSKMSVPQDMAHKADILVTETFDAGLFGEGILPTLCHAWTHLLKNGDQERGQVIPGRAQLYLQAVECDSILKESRFLWKFEGLTTTGIHICGSTGLCESEPYTAHDLSHLLGGYRTLSEPLKFMDVNFNDCQELNTLNKGDVQEMMVEITSNGRLDAVAVWFTLQLDDSHVISTYTGSHSCWEQAVFSVHSGKIKEHPMSRGPMFDMNVKPGDMLRVLYAIVGGAKLSMDVAAVLSPDEASVYSSNVIPQFLNDADILWRHSVYCLTQQEVKVLNNTILYSAQYQRMQELFFSLKKDSSEIDFYHLNDGFSPLCLQALKCGFHHSVISVHGQYQAALLQKMATINNIDMQNLQFLEDISCHKPSQMGEDKSWSYGTPGSVTADMHQKEDSQTQSLGKKPVQVSNEQSAVIFCDFVDTHGRLVEGLQGQAEALRYHLSKYKAVAVAPCSLDVYGVLIDSEKLLRLSRIQSDDNTLGFNIGSFVNKYATRNHQDISLAALPHTKLTEPFKMFTVNVCKMFDVLEPADSETEQTLNVPEEIIITPQNTESCFSEQENNKLYIPHSQSSSDDRSNLSECKHVLEFNSSSTISIPEGETISTTQFTSEINFPVQENCANNSHHQISLSCENEEKHLEIKLQNVCSNIDDKSKSSVSENNVKNPAFNVEKIKSNVGTHEKLSTKEISMKKEIELTNSFYSYDCNVKHKQCPSDCKFSCKVGAEKNEDSSPRIKCRRLNGIDVDYDAFPDYNLNTEDGELVQSVNLKVPVIHTGSITAMVYWFELHFSPNCSISTIDPTHHWHQAAVMTLPSQNQHVTAGDTLNLFCQINGSAINFMIE